MINYSNLAKKQTKTSGYLLLLTGVLFQGFILLGSISPQAIIDKPFIYALTQILPIFFIEAGLYNVIKSEKMKVTNIRGKYKIDDASLLTYRTYSIYKNVKFLIILGVLLLVFVIFTVYMISTRGIKIDLPFYFTFGSAIFYLLILRRIFIYLYNSNKDSKYNFLTNFAFWLSIVFLIFSSWILYTSLFNPEMFINKITKNQTINNLLFSTLGVLFILVSLLMLYYSINKKGLKYEFNKNNLILTIPLNPFQNKSAIIPISKILQVKKVNTAELNSLQESFEKQTVGFIEIKDLIYDFLKDIRPYPRYYQYIISQHDAIYIKGKDFDYLINIVKPDEFIKNLKNIKGV